MKESTWWLSVSGAVAIAAALSSQLSFAKPAASPESSGLDLSALAKSLPEDGSCLEIQILHQDDQLGADGVEQHSRYEDRMLRCQSQVWTERQLPPAVAHLKSEEPHIGHSHEELPPLYQMAKWIRPSAGGTDFSFVAPQEHKQISVPHEEYDSIGFDGSYEAAYSILRAQTLKGMKLLREEPQFGLRELEKKTSAHKAHVVWSERLKLPVYIETQSADGRFHERMEFRIRRADPARLPWQAVSAYERVEISAYRD